MKVETSNIRKSRAEKNRNFVPAEGIVHANAAAGTELKKKDNADVFSDYINDASL